MFATRPLHVDFFDERDRLHAKRRGATIFSAVEPG
jgi:hypothetical protein